MTASLFLLASAFFHALWNALAKRSPAPSLQVVGILIFASVFALAFIPFFPGPGFPSSSSLAWAIGAGVFEAGYVITLAITLERSALGLSYTIMRGGAMLLVWAISGTLLAEKLTPLVLLGVAIVVGGLYLTTQASRLKGQSSGTYLWAYLCAIFIGGYHLCYGRALEASANPAHLFALALWIAVPALLIFSGKKTLRALTAQFKLRPLPMAVAGLISALSFLLFLVGLRHSGAGFALTLRNTSVIFAQIFAVMIGEGVGVPQWVGALLVALGASLVTLGG